jgi:putative ABC transport system permease protein
LEQIIAMLQTYFLTAWRHLKSHKVYTLINVLGLTLSITCSILIFVLVRYHLSFDNFHQDSNRIYRLITEFHEDGVSRVPAVPTPVGKAFRNDYHFAEATARSVAYNGALISLPQASNGTEVKKFQETYGLAYTEPAFFDIFHFPLIEGQYSSLGEPHHALITEDIAKKYFGTTQAMGKVIRYNNKYDFTVTGILRNLPSNTDQKQEIYVSYENLKDADDFLGGDNSWGGVYGQSKCYVKLRPGVTQASVEAALWPGFSKKYYTGDDQNTWRYKLQPLNDIHFNTELGGSANKTYLIAVAFVGLFLIITSCVNFVNLATAQALNRSKEIGVRKVLGSQPKQLFWQFMSETSLITIFALVLGIGLAWACVPSFNSILKVKMSMDLFGTWTLPVFLVGTLIIVIILAGSYPGMILARFRPVLALKGKLDQSHIGGFSLRRVLVVLQFSISQLLIIGTLVIAGQIHFSEKTDLGFKNNNIAMVRLPTTDSLKMYSLRVQVLQIPGVKAASLCFDAPASRRNQNTIIQYDNRPDKEHWGINIKPVDENYLSTFGLKLVAGRNLFPSDTVKEYVLNELAVKRLGLKSPQDVIGHKATINGIPAPVVGVVKDFYNQSFKGEVQPQAFASSRENYNNIAIDMQGAQTREVLASVQKLWSNAYPDYVYSATFLDESIAKFYEEDAMMLTLIEVFAGIAIFIGCLGLYGLVSFMANRKTKEIGVRKVLGAGLNDILWLFGKEFLRLVLIAFLVAAPLGYWAMHRYLESFKFRIPMNWAIFVPALGVTCVIAALTVSYRSWKAASVQPVKSLRSE